MTASASLPVAVLLKDDYFIRGAGLPGRFKAEKVEFHWGPSNGSDGSEHSINGRRFPVEVTTGKKVSASIRANRLLASAMLLQSVLKTGGGDSTVSLAGC